MNSLNQGSSKGMDPILNHFFMGVFDTSGKGLVLVFIGKVRVADFEKLWHNEQHPGTFSVRMTTHS